MRKGQALQRRNLAAELRVHALEVLLEEEPLLRGRRAQRRVVVGVGANVAAVLLAHVETQPALAEQRLRLGQEGWRRRELHPHFVDVVAAARHIAP